MFLTVTVERLAVALALRNAHGVADAIGELAQQVGDGAAMRIAGTILGEILDERSQRALPTGYSPPARPHSA